MLRAFWKCLQKGDGRECRAKGMWVLHANEKQVLMDQVGEGQDFWKDYLTNRWCLHIWPGQDSEP